MFITGIYVGIDPGVSGGIAVLDQDRVVFNAERMPDTERDLFGMLESAAALSANVHHAVLERVHGGIGGPGGRRQGAAGMFTYGKNYGAILMALTAVEIPFDTLPPQQWQKAIGVTYPKGATQTERKNISKRRAQQLFPSLTVTHAIADALLLAETCRRIHAGGNHRRAEDSIHGEEEVCEEDRQLEERQRAERQEFEEDQRGGEGFTTASERRAQAAEAGRAPRHGAGARSRARPAVRVDR